MKHVLTNAYSCQIVFICTLINKLFTWPNFCLPQCTFTSVFVLPVIWLYCLACCLTVVVCCYVFNPDVSWNLRSPKPLDITEHEVHVHTDRLCIWTVNLTVCNCNKNRWSMLIVHLTKHLYPQVQVYVCLFLPIWMFCISCNISPSHCEQELIGNLNFKWLNQVIFGSVVFLHRFLKSM